MSSSKLPPLDFYSIGVDRIADALERIADAMAPTPTQREDAETYAEADARLRRRDARDPRQAEERG